MESLALAALVVFTAWQVIAIRKEAKAREYSTTVFLTIDSEEEDASGIPRASYHLRRTIQLPFAVVPGMGMSVGDRQAIPVARVIFDEFRRGVHLESKRAPVATLEGLAASYIKSGWQNSG